MVVGDFVLRFSLLLTSVGGFDARFLSFWDSTKVLFCVSFYIQMLTEILMQVSYPNQNQQEQETAFLTAFAIPVLQ